ncbi:WD repeat-containing protein [Cryptosporidium ubiquitum]|uniref:WD repeat-containing protein n=1 Tax=Cryptosporidium ubiquitum TaxID=857276 RepID=A0A1J4MIA6_9CRYT|nr:WD repeat-containing protein [Cryptosporidium ubiquitum]OII72764.1 WD repeat-containing protein [Cryptosporidium ubiquitum]
MKSNKSLSLVDYSSSSQSEDDEKSTVKQCKKPNTEVKNKSDSQNLKDFNANTRTEQDIHQIRSKLIIEKEHEDSDEEDGINSLSNIMNLRKKMESIIGDSVIEYPVKHYVQFRKNEDIPNQDLEENCKIKPVTTISVSNKGNRMICGVINGEIEIYDFSNLYENDMNPNKVICPLENHSIQKVEFNENGNLFLAACGDSVCRIFQSNGEFITGTVQGDPYVKSVKSNPGHTHMILNCKWDPGNANRFLTCSIDNTIRLFDLNSDPFGVDRYIPSTFVMKCLDKRNLNISSIQANSLCISSFGEKVAVSCTDGSIQIFSRNSNSYSETPSIIIRDAHKFDKNANIKSISDITFVKYNLNQDTYLASRGIIDKSVKIWDIRKTNIALKTINNLPSDGNENSRLVLSKCGTNIVTSSTLIKDEISNVKNSFNGKNISNHAKSSLVSFQIDSLINSAESNFHKLITLNNKVISTFEWSHEINQIFVALNNSSIIAYYDDQLENNPSNNGILSAFGKKRKYQFQGFSNASLETYNIEELPDGFKETKSGEIKYVGSSLKKKSKLYAPKHPNL